MKFSVTLTIVILFCLVLAAYLYLTPPQAEKDPASRFRSARLVDLQAGDEIREVSIRHKDGQTLVMERVKEGWRITEPFDYPADPLVVDGVLAALRLSPKEGEALPENGWAEYGLEDPALEVGVRTVRRPQLRRLFLGEPSPVGSRIFARWDDGETYFLLDEQIRNVFSSSIYSFREKKVFRTPLKAVTKLRFQSGLDAYEIIEGLTGWVWMEPVTFLGKDVAADTADRMLALVQNTYIKEFVEEGVPADTGFPEAERSEESIRIQVWENTEKEPEILYLGKEAPAKDAFYARRSGEPTVFLVARGHIIRLFELLSAEAGKITGQTPAGAEDQVFTPSGV